MIKKRNLDSTLIQWIMVQSGSLGAGVGEIQYVAPAASATSEYSTYLADQGITTGNLHALPSIALESCKANRNDVVLVEPGTYSETETLSWDKAQTHMIGIGNPTWRQGGKVRVQTVTSGVGATIDVTASGVFFGGFNITNNHSTTTNLTALRISATYFGARNMDLRGQLAANQISGINTSSLEFAAGSSYGFGSTFTDCNFGTASQPTRTGKNGIIYFAPTTGSGSQSGYLRFIRCSIEGRAQTATIPMVLINQSPAIDRYVLFKDCFFYNFWDLKAGKLANVFDFTTADANLSNGLIILDKCTGYGIEEWWLDGVRTGFVVSTDGNSGLTSVIYG